MILGVVFGALAIQRGETGLGAVGVILSILLGIVGIMFGIAAFGG